MKKKVLVVASTMIHINNFHREYIKELQKEYDVKILAPQGNEETEPDFNVILKKKIFSCQNFKTIGKIRKILKENEFDIVFLNTTLAAFFVRMAIMGLKKKPYVVNIVHGYLFGKNTLFLKNLGLLLAEKFCKKVTDTVVVMNNEDYDIAKKHKLYKDGVYKIKGMGVDGNRFAGQEKPNTNNTDDVVFSFVGEISSRKNQKFLIKFIKNLKQFDFKSKLYLIGYGDKRESLEKFTKRLKLEDSVKFVGYDTDIAKYLNETNYYISSSKIEGLPFNILEAMQLGKIIITANTKGCCDLIKDFENGILYKFNNINDLTNKFRLVKNNLTLQQKLSKNAKLTVDEYLFSNVFDDNVKLFKSFINKAN